MSSPTGGDKKKEEEGGGDVFVAGVALRFTCLHTSFPKHSLAQPHDALQLDPRRWQQLIRSLSLSNILNCCDGVECAF